MRILLSLVFCVCHTMVLTAQHTGQWQTDELDLPQYHYTGPISYAQIADGSLPDDPWFILGNYRMTVFAHASGAYEMMTGERAWAKINHRSGRQGGNGARLIVGDSSHDLTGTNSQAAHDAKKIFGTGFASYKYKQRDTDLPESSPSLIASIHGVRNSILDAFISDLGDRAFSRRAYMRTDYPVGEDNMFLAPHGYLLQIPEFPVDRKRALIGTIEYHLMHNEVMGARQSEVAYNTIQKAGEGENAGFWYALYGPVVAGVSIFDKHLASEMLSGMLRENYARHYPDYWIGHWSGGDNINSSLSDMPGLVNSTQKALVAFPVFCGHAHAWPLYCYLLINENHIRE